MQQDKGPNDITYTSPGSFDGSLELGTIQFVYYLISAFFFGDLNNGGSSRILYTSIPLYMAKRAFITKEVDFVVCMLKLKTTFLQYV